MKIIEALKKIKHIDRKIEKTTVRVSDWCSYIRDKEISPDEDPPLYNEEEIRRMIQQIDDWVVEKANLRHLLHKTNLSTTVGVWGKQYTIDQLLGLKEIVIPQQISIRGKLRRKEKGGWVDTSKGKITVTQFDPKERDKAVDSLENQQEEISNLLDKLTLETDLVE